jgi:hypothetical protein
MPIVYDDYTSLSYYYTQDEADKKQVDILAGINELSKRGNIVLTDEKLEFSYAPCACCNNNLAGTRFGIELI